MIVYTSAPGTNSECGSLLLHPQAPVLLNIGTGDIGYGRWIDAPISEPAKTKTNNHRRKEQANITPLYKKQPVTKLIESKIRAGSGGRWYSPI